MTPSSTGSDVGPHVLILLATFNGGHFLAEQLSSIEAQTHGNWTLLVSDDGSSDGSMDQVVAFAEKFPGRVRVRTGPRAGSPAENFFSLLRHAPSSPFVALCDQDDVWLPHKLERLVGRCVELETRFGSHTPCLTFSDLQVVDSRLTQTDPSFFAEIAVCPREITFGSLLVEGAIPGCAMLLNEALIDRFNSYSGSLADARMHDRWLSLIAFSLGKVAWVEDPLVLYRQHGANSAGSVRRNTMRHAIAKLRRRDRAETAANYRQARLFLSAYERELPARELAQVSALSELEKRGKLVRIFVIIKMRLLKQGWQRRIYQMIRD